MLGGRLI